MRRRAGLWGHVVVSRALHAGVGGGGLCGVGVETAVVVPRASAGGAKHRKGKQAERGAGSSSGAGSTSGHSRGSGGSGSLRQRCAGGLGPRLGGQRLLLFLKIPSTLRGSYCTW